MTQGINDKVLGSRFWVANDFQPLQQNDNASNVANAQLIQHRPAIKVKHDSTAFSFATNGEDAMVKSAINKAEIFAASHTLSEEERNQETAKALPEIIRVLRERGYRFGVVTPMTPQPW